jgi:flagellin FlaB
MTSDPSTNRRTLLRSTAALLGAATTGGMAGCLGGSSSDADGGPLLGGGDSGRAEYVPTSASGIGHVDVDALLSDSQLRAGINSTASTVAGQTAGLDGPTTVEGWLDRIEADAGYDPRKLNEVLGFYTTSADLDAEDGATVAWTDWSNSTVRGALEDGGSSFTEESYRGKTLYVPEYGGPLAVLSDGTYAVGSESAVRGVVDVATGNAEALSGTLRTLYDNTRGMARWATVVPEGTFDSAAVGGVDASTLQGVTHATTSLYRDGSQRGMDATLVASSTDRANAIKSTLQAGKQLALDQLQQARSRSAGAGPSEFYFEGMRTYLQEATISRNDASVTVSYTASAEQFVRNSPILFVFAGVLINTAGFLQSRAEQTGQQASEQVTNRLQVTSAVGTDIANGRIGTVEIVVMKAPGSADISLHDAVVQWVDSEGAATLVSADATGGGQGTFAVSAVQDVDRSIADQGVLNDPDDRAQLRIDIGERNTVPESETDSIGALAEGESAAVVLTTGSGGETQLRLTVPESLSGANAVEL